MFVMLEHQYSSPTACVGCFWLYGISFSDFSKSIIASRIPLLSPFDYVLRFSVMLHVFRITLSSTSNFSFLLCTTISLLPTYGDFKHISSTSVVFSTLLICSINFQGRTTLCHRDGRIVLCGFCVGRMICGYVNGKDFM
jgi:hypothetical protein